MTSIWVAAAILAAATQADAGAAPRGDARIEAAFTYVYTASYAPAGAAGGASRAFTREAEVIVTGNPPGPISRLRGRCTGIGIVGTATYEYTMTGWCLMKDADGDLIVERFEEAWPGGWAAASGTGEVRGGTGKFSGISGRYDYATRSCVAPSERACHGAGRRVGARWQPAD